MPGSAPGTEAADVGQGGESGPGRAESELPARHPSKDLIQVGTVSAWGSKQRRWAKTSFGESESRNEVKSTRRAPAVRRGAGLNPETTQHFPDAGSSARCCGVEAATGEGEVLELLGRKALQPGTSLRGCSWRQGI